MPTAFPPRHHATCPHRRAMLGSLVAACAGVAGAAAPRKRIGLLIGVSRVPALPERLWLQGPDHDVALMRDVLLANGFDAASLSVLASRVPGAAEPTYARVQAGLEALLAHCAPGVQVVLHFAGHGSQVPAVRGEADGQAEVLLLQDVQPWQGSAREGHLPNTLSDASLSRAIGAMCARGAQVWAFIDACHAAGLVRQAPPAVEHRRRAVPATELGVPVPDWSDWAPAARGALRVDTALPPAVPLQGRVYAMAARSREAAIEAPLPAADGGRRVHGLLTWSLAEAIRQAQIGDAASLRRALLQHYSQFGHATPVPQVLGDPALRWAAPAGRG